jgi:hypothetical protein
MLRLYYLTKELRSVEQVSKDLHDNGITDWHFHVHSKDEAGLYKKHVHSANYVQQRDIIRYGERGAVIAVFFAVLAVLFVMMAKPFGEQTHALVYISIFGFITLFGAWVGGLAGLATENQSLARFHDEVAAGYYLLMVDVKKEQTDEVKQLMAEKHPEADFKGSESTLILPFSNGFKSDTDSQAPA